MRKTYKAPLTRIVGLDPDELLQIQGASQTGLDGAETGSGNSGDSGITEGDTKGQGIWNWSNNDR